MTICPKCGCDWEKFHHRVTSTSKWTGINYHCINCGNYLCYAPKTYGNSGIDGLQSDFPICFGNIGECPLRGLDDKTNQKPMAYHLRFVDNCPVWRECRDYLNNRTKKPNPSRRDSLNHDI